MSAKLRRFWFRFQSLPKFSPLGLGCGVTAFTHDDALSIMSETIFKDRDIPPISEVIEDVDISSLDHGHVIPNMEPHVLRGVWFPKGYSFLR